MSQDQTKKEALFNEVKGSLFEYLVALSLSRKSAEELQFLQSLDKNYLHVLSQQDRMVRQFYPEMLSFLNQMAEASAQSLVSYLGELPKALRLRGKFTNSSLSSELHEADLLFETTRGQVPLSLKLNKRQAYVNTKSGGIKSFFTQYFPFISADHQQKFNQLVDQEFLRMSYELHALNDMEFSGDYKEWVASGKSELPGELNEEERKVLKAFYARLAVEMHHILTHAQLLNPESFRQGLEPLMGFSSKEILQLVCFHDFKGKDPAEVQIHPYEQLQAVLAEAKLLAFHDTSSVDVAIGPWALQIRVKPMNKFTTTAIKINCSVKFKPSDVSQGD